MAYHFPNTTKNSRLGTIAGRIHFTETSFNVNVVSYIRHIPFLRHKCATTLWQDTLCQQYLEGGLYPLTKEVCKQKRQLV